MTFIRRNIWTLLANDPWDPVTEAYARAVATMQSRPATDPTSWSFQAAIHGAYAAPPAGALWNECQHASWFFLPWHRMYLYFFERIVRAAVISNGSDPQSAQFALPYWNYDEPTPRNTLPKPLRAPTLPSGGSNPLRLRPGRRSTAIANGARLSPLVTSSAAAMALTSFIGPPGPGFGGGREAPVQFGGSTGGVEQTPHNAIHVQVGGAGNGQCQGGLMIDPNCAALDPVFWLHHANIDRLWNRWIDLGGGRANPTDVAWRNQSFTLYDESGTPVSMTCADVVNTAIQLDYGYDDDPASPAIIMSTPAAPQPPPGPAAMVAATDRPVELAGQRASVTLTVPPSTRPEVATMGVARAAAPGGGAVFLNVEDIEAPQNPGVVYGVFLNAPEGASETERDRHHVGNITLFGIESMNDPDRAHAGVPGFRHTFDITQVVGQLSAEGRWDPDAIRVTFEPLTPMAEPPAEPEPGVASVAAVEAPSAELAHAAQVPVRIGRVSLFFS